MDVNKAIASKPTKRTPRKTAVKLVVRDANAGRLIVNSGSYKSMIKESGISKEDIAKAREYVKAAKSYAP
jgi:hypothetical protein